MEEEIDIKDLLIALWRKKWIIILVTGIFFVLGFILYGRNTTTQETEEVEVEQDVIYTKELDKDYIETDFFLSRGINKELDGTVASYRLAMDESVVANLDQFATSQNFLKKLLEELNLSSDIEEVENLQKSILVRRSRNSDIVRLIISCEKEDTEATMYFSNRILEEIKEKIGILYNISEVIVVDGPRTLNEENIDLLMETLNAESQKNTKTEVVTNSNTIEKTPTSPKKKMILVTAVGFVLACGCIVVVELLNNSVKNSRQLEAATNLKTLVRIPKTDLDISNQLEVLRVSMNHPKSVLVTSPEERDGKSFIALNLAKTYARIGKKTILIHAERLLKEEIEKIDEEENIKNLTTLLSYEDAPSLLQLDDSQIKERIEKLEKTYDMVIIDSKNVLESANTLRLSKFVEATILVSSERKTKLENCARAKNIIEDMGGKIVGNVFNNSIEK